MSTINGNIIIMKNPIKYSRVLIALAIGTLFANAQDNNCQELLEYRKNNIITEYKKTLNDYKINSEHIEFIRELKNELKDDTAWATSDWVSAIIGIKAAANAIESTLSLTNIKGVKNATKLGKNLYNLIQVYKKIDSSYDIAESAINNKKDIYLLIAKELGTILEKAIDLHENVKLFQEQKALKKDVNLALNRYQNQIIKYEAFLKKAESNLDDIKTYLSQLDYYLKKNCKEELKKKPIDIESKLWSVNDGTIDIANLNYKLNELLNDPDISNYYDFNNPRLLEEIMQLINSQNFNSTNLDDYLNKVMKILEKYRLNKSEILNNRNKSINVTRSKKLAKPKAARAVNTSSYSNFVGKNKSPNNGPYYSRATNRKPSLKKINQKNKSKKSGCGHDHSNSSVVCQ